ncbi:MAG: putative toxin-antitoxin system toxin component, PIN family [Ekhidna sp.]|uniref:putative toxin-antitoxin system toxin component, PIN family n=1 Tax=Ekhidna sp. TaxID=2608089 RepID=UPI0032EE8A67
MRVFTDTNFLLSALITDGFSQRVFEEILEQHEPVYSMRVRDELIRKLKTKFQVPNDRIHILLYRIKTYGLVADAEKVKYKLRDANDEIILATAISEKAEVIVTGDKDLLSMNDSISEIEILTPRQFWEKYHEP